MGRALEKQVAKLNNVLEFHMLSRFMWVFGASVVFFLFCRYLVFKRPITAEDARKVFLLLIFLALVGFAIFDIFIF